MLHFTPDSFYQHFDLFLLHTYHKKLKLYEPVKSQHMSKILYDCMYGSLVSAPEGTVLELELFPGCCTVAAHCVDHLGWVKTRKQIPLQGSVKNN